MRTLAENAFEVDAILLNGSVMLIGGTEDPSTGDGLEAPIGTLFIMNDGTTRRKIGPTDIEWTHWLPSSFITQADVLALISANQSGAHTGIAELDFGTFQDRTSHASINIIGQTTITTSSRIYAYISSASTIDHNADELLVCGIEISINNIIPGVGFTIHGLSRFGRDYGKFKIIWSYS